MLNFYGERARLTITWIRGGAAVSMRGKWQAESGGDLHMSKTGFTTFETCPANHYYTVTLV